VNLLPERLSPLPLRESTRESLPQRVSQVPVRSKFETPAEQLSETAIYLLQAKLDRLEDERRTVRAAIEAIKREQRHAEFFVG
jgi:hypothetical protein